MLERYVQNELNKLDPDLFLDKEWYQGTLVYTVKHNIGSGHPPLKVLDWMVGNEPLPLSPSIVDQVKRQEGSIKEAISQVKVNNAVMAMRARKEMDEIAETIADEFDKSSKVLHRSGPWKSKYDVTAYKKPST